MPQQIISFIFEIPLLHPGLDTAHKEVYALARRFRKESGSPRSSHSKQIHGRYPELLHQMNYHFVESCTISAKSMYHQQFGFLYLIYIVCIIKVNDPHVVLIRIFNEQILGQIGAIVAWLADLSFRLFQKPDQILSAQLGLYLLELVGYIFIFDLILIWLDVGIFEQGFVCVVHVLGVNAFQFISHYDL